MTMGANQPPPPPHAPSPSIARGDSDTTISQFDGDAQHQSDASLTQLVHIEHKMCSSPSSSSGEGCKPEVGTTQDGSLGSALMGLGGSSQSLCLENILGTAPMGVTQEVQSIVDKLVDDYMVTASDSQPLTETVVDKLVDDYLVTASDALLPETAVVATSHRMYATSAAPPPAAAPASSLATSKFLRHHDETASATTPAVTNTGRWTAEEHGLFVEALGRHGRDWRKIASHVGTRTQVQVRTHSQKYFQKLEKARRGAGNGGEAGGTADGGAGARTKAPLGGEATKALAANATKRKIGGRGMPLANHCYPLPTIHAANQAHVSASTMPSNYRLDPSSFEQAYRQAYAQGFAQGAAGALSSKKPDFDRSTNSPDTSYRVSYVELDTLDDSRENLGANKKMKMEDGSNRRFLPA